MTTRQNRPQRHTPYNMPKLRRDPQRLHKRSKKAPTVLVKGVGDSQFKTIPARQVPARPKSPWATWGIGEHLTLASLREIFGRDGQPRAQRAKAEAEPWWHKHYRSKAPKFEQEEGWNK